MLSSSLFSADGSSAGRVARKSEHKKSLSIWFGYALTSF